MASLAKGPRPVFQWKASGLPQNQRNSYSLRVVELEKGNTLSDALRKNQPVLEQKNLNGSSFQTPEKVALLDGKIYAAQVTVVGPKGDEVARSGPSFFAISYWPSFCFLLPASSTIDFCVGQSFTLAYIVSTSGGSYNWSLSGAGAASGSASGAVIVPAGAISASGSYTLTLTPTSSSTCNPTPVQFQLNAHQPPVAGTINVSTTNPQPICPSDAAVLTLNGSSGNVQWYSSVSPSNVFSSANVMLGATGTVLNTNSLSQTTYYGVTVSSPNGGPCPPVQSQVVSVQVKPLPVAPVISPPSTMICLGGTATIHVNSASGNGTYQWICNGAPLGSSTTTPPTSLTVSNPGNYALELNDNIPPPGCSTVSSNVVSIQLDTLAVTINAPCCAHSGQKIPLTAQATGGTGGYQYHWTNPSGHTSPGVLVIVHTTTTYSVIVTDSHGCQVTAAFVVTVCP